MLKKQVWMAVFLGVFAVVSLTGNTAHAWRIRPALRPRSVVVVPQPVVVRQPVVVQQPMVVQRRPVYVRSYRRVYRPVWGW
jgi:hypothetical protein